MAGQCWQGRPAALPLLSLKHDRPAEARGRILGRHAGGARGGAKETPENPEVLNWYPLPQGNVRRAELIPSSTVVRRTYTASRSVGFMPGVGPWFAKGQAGRASHPTLIQDSGSCTGGPDYLRSSMWSGVGRAASNDSPRSRIVLGTGLTPAPAALASLPTALVDACNQFRPDGYSRIIPCLCHRLLCHEGPMTDLKLGNLRLFLT